MATGLGYKLRTGGGLEDKVFGSFGTAYDDEEETTDLDGAAVDAAELKEAKAWAKKQNVEAARCCKTFTFQAYLPQTAEEDATLYAKFLAMHKTPGAFALYK